MHFSSFIAPGINTKKLSGSDIVFISEYVEMGNDVITNNEMSKIHTDKSLEDGTIDNDGYYSFTLEHFPKDGIPTRKTSGGTVITFINDYSGTEFDEFDVVLVEGDKKKGKQNSICLTFYDNICRCYNDA